MRQGIRAVTLPRVHRVKKGGKVYRWYRPTRIKLPDDIPETHPDFIAAWAEAEASSRPSDRKASGGTIAAEIESLLASKKFKAYSKVYRHEVRRESDAIRELYGTAPISGLREHHIRADLDKLTDRQANARLKTWRLICKGAKERAKISTDPTAGLHKINIKTDGYAAWNLTEITAFREKWQIGTVQRACFELLFWTAARTVDAVQIGPQHISRSDGVLVFSQSKTGGKAYIPWTSALPDYALGWADDREMMHEAIKCLSGGLTFLQTAAGKPRSVKGLGNIISEAARDAKLDGRSAHGLRKSRLTLIAECGGSAHSIMAWGGHKTLAEAQKYTASAQMKRLVMGTEQDQNAVNFSRIPVNQRKNDV